MTRAFPQKPHHQPSGDQLLPEDSAVILSDGP